MRMLAMPPPQFSLGKCGRLRWRGAWTWLLASVTQWKTYFATPRKLQHSDSRHQLGCVGILLICVLSGGDDKGCMNLGFTLGIDTAQLALWRSGGPNRQTRQLIQFCRVMVKFRSPHYIIIYTYYIYILYIYIYIIFPDKDPGYPG